MAFNARFLVTNTTDSTNTITLKSLKVKTNYGSRQTEVNSKKEGEATIYDNKTSVGAKKELLEFRAYDIGAVNTKLAVAHPSGCTAGINYAAQLESLVEITSTTDSTFLIDTPIVSYITVRHENLDELSDTIIGDQLDRLISSMKDEAGNWRIADFRRKCTKVEQD